MPTATLADEDAGERGWQAEDSSDDESALSAGRRRRAGYNFHTLRHTFASHYVMRGGSLVMYAQLAPDHLSGATSILAGLGTSKNSAWSAHGAPTAASTASVWYKYASYRGTAAYPSG